MKVKPLIIANDDYGRLGKGDIKEIKDIKLINLSIILVIIVNNLSSMHRECHDFYAVRVYLRSYRISLVRTPKC